MKVHNRILSILLFLALVPFSALSGFAQNGGQAADQGQNDDQSYNSSQAQPDQGQPDQSQPQTRPNDDQSYSDQNNSNNPAYNNDDQGYNDNQGNDNRDRSYNDNQSYDNSDRGYNAQMDQSQPAPPPGQSNSTQRDQQPVDPPARAARLQYISGSVSVQPHGTDDWVTGQINRPLTNADNIWADKSSRAEVSVGSGLIRIDSESSLTLTNIAENTIQLQLHQGAMYLHVRRLYDNEIYEIDTPNQAFTVLKPGDYRFDVDPNSDRTVITVWRGEGESTGDGPAVRIHDNQQARFTNGTSLKHDIHDAPAADAFDQWATARDGRFDHSESARHVSPDVPGSEDLDEYGSWRNTPDYGDVWVPSGVSVGWSPYRFGHWIWVAPWGWTWVEDEPWGYAPFHYGRWVYYNNFWGWAPGPVFVRPYYAPALVAWFGGPGFGVGFGFGFGGGFGWCPLGFGEPFVPWFGVSRGYFRSVNFTNTRITNIRINNVYERNFINGRPRPGGGIYNGRGEQMRFANMHSPNGFTAVSRDTLVNSRSVARNAVRVSPSQLSHVSAVHGLAAAPTREARLGGNVAGRGAMPPPRSFSRPVVSHIAAPGNRGVTSVRNSGPNSNIRMPNRGAMQSRSVPRPPNAGGMDRGLQNRGSENRGGDNRGFSSRGQDSRGAMSSPRSNERIGSPRGETSAPRSSGIENRGAAPSRAPEAGRGGGTSAPHSEGGHSGGPRSEMSVPRPPNAEGRGSSGYDRSPSYQASNRTAPTLADRSYGGSTSRPSPSYDRGATNGSYGRSPSYGGGNSRSMPSYGASRSYGAGAYGGGSYGGRAPSYSARSYGGGGRSSGGYSGGGRASVGGGGHVSAPSHSSGGGGHSSSGGSSSSHGGRH